jgi:two-component system, cell cycle sensor histidine kinase and response regulator CckA
MEEKAETAAYSLPRGSETVLIAEDDEALRALVRIALETCGYSVLAATGGADALRLARLHGGPISLLVSDVVMPGMDGPELARRLAACRPGLKVLLFSGYPGEADLLPSGAAFLQKPFRPSRLVEKVREVLDAEPPAPLPSTRRPAEAASCAC